MITYDNWSINLLVIAVTAMTVALSVLVHYEGLVWLSSQLQRWHQQRRRKVLYGVYAVLALHVVEIWLFGFAIWLLLAVPDTGAVVGVRHVQLLDSVYLSAMTFTTVGFGDLSPRGPLRFLSGTEALTGFMLIAWSASFLYLEMERFWRER